MNFLSKEAAEFLGRIRGKANRIQGAIQPIQEEPEPGLSLPTTEGVKNNEDKLAELNQRFEEILKKYQIAERLGLVKDGIWKVGSVVPIMEPKRSSITTPHYSWNQYLKQGLPYEGVITGYSLIHEFPTMREHITVRESSTIPRGPDPRGPMTTYEHTGRYYTAPASVSIDVILNADQRESTTDRRWPRIVTVAHPADFFVSFTTHFLDAFLPEGVRELDRDAFLSKNPSFRTLVAGRFLKDGSGIKDRLSDEIENIAAAQVAFNFLPTQLEARFRAR